MRTNSLVGLIILSVAAIKNPLLNSENPRVRAYTKLFIFLLFFIWIVSAIAIFYMFFVGGPSMLRSEWSWTPAITGLSACALYVLVILVPTLIMWLSEEISSIADDLRSSKAQRAVRKRVRAMKENPNYPNRW